jgi:hypothetical protein
MSSSSSSSYDLSYRIQYVQPSSVSKRHEGERSSIQFVNSNLCCSLYEKAVLGEERRGFLSKARLNSICQAFTNWMNTLTSTSTHKPNHLNIHKDTLSFRHIVEVWAYMDFFLHMYLSLSLANAHHHRCDLSQYIIIIEYDETVPCPSSPGIWSSESNVSSTAFPYAECQLSVTFLVKENVCEEKSNSSSSDIFPLLSVPVLTSISKG